MKYDERSHRRSDGYRYRPTGRPTPREIEILRAVIDGRSLTTAAKTLGIPVTSVASILSTLYTRLGIKDRSEHHLSKDRRLMAVKIGVQEGWWTEDAQTATEAAELRSS